jgi:alpha-glucosidase
MGRHRVLNGEPGEFVTIARRHGDEWYLGSLINWTSRNLRISLESLEKGTHKAENYEDATDADQNPQHISIRPQSVQGSNTLVLHLASGGGCGIRFVPTNR